MNVAPGGPFSSRCQLSPDQTGLVGTIRFRLIDNDATPDDPLYGPSTDAILEDPSGSGVYLFRGTAPLVEGVYSPIWDLGPGTELFIDENLVITGETSSVVIPSGHDYITLSQLKTSLEMTGLTFADDDMMVSISAASRMVDYITNRRFWKDSDYSTRTYIPYWSRVYIDDLIEYDTVTSDVGESTYPLEEGSDFMLLPLNAAADGHPFETIQFLQTSYFPDRGFPSLAVRGLFGWPSIPENVVAATTILAARVLRRQREAPFGIVTVGIEQGAVARIAATDPDVKALLDDFTKERVLISLA